MNDTTTTPADSLRRDQSAAKKLFVGEILEQNLFPYPSIRARDREILGTVVEAIRLCEGAVRRLAALS